MSINNGTPSPGQQYDLKKQNLATLDTGDARGRNPPARTPRNPPRRPRHRDAKRGNLGFVYNADTNEYVRMVSGLKEPEMPEPPPPLMLDQ